MDALQKRAEALQKSFEEGYSKADIEELAKQLAELNKQMASPDFWQDTKLAAEVSKQQSNLEQRVQPWQQIKQDINEIYELASLNDQSLTADLEVQLNKCESAYDILKKSLKFTGPYDQHNAILSIYAGAGGTDAQDWAAMLVRMYLRWCEQSGLKAKIIDESAGEEAGIKSTTIEVSGATAYGKLKGEHGVHRLVRLSPFNSDNLRQTSFAKVEVLPEIDQPEAVEIDEKDLKIDVYRSGGHGGQSVNTTDSAVRITHMPTGISVAIQNERSQLQNKETAMTILRSKLIQLQLEQHADKISELKGENEQAAWGNQIRSYVLHPYKQVKDLRSGHTETDTDAVLDGKIDGFIEAL